MPVDSSIYFQQQAPDLLGSVQRGLSMRDMIDQKKLRDQGMKDQEMIKQAYKKNLSTGPDGKASFNREGLIQDLAAVDPKESMRASDLFAKQDATTNQSRMAQMQTLQAQLKMAGDLAWSINDQQSYDLARQKAIKMGLPGVEDMPREYDPRLVDRLKTQALTAQEQIAQKWKEQEMRLKERAFSQKANAKNDKVAAEIAKEERKEMVQVKKENRKERQKLDSAESSLSTQLQGLKELKKQFQEYSQNSRVGTGPIATLGGLKTMTDQKLEALDSKFKKVQLDEMVKMFAGMSKAVDSEAERRAFESTQPSIKLDDPTNEQLLNEKIAAAESLLAKTRAAKNNFDKFGEFRPVEQPEEVGPVSQNQQPVFTTNEIEWAD